MNEAALLAYFEESERIEAQVRVRIQELADQGRPVLVWGVGTHTATCLGPGRWMGWGRSLGGLRSKLQGKEMRGASVTAPEAVNCAQSPSSCPAARSTTKSPPNPRGPLRRQ